MSLHTTTTPLSDEIMRLRAELERVNEALHKWQESAVAEEARCKALEFELASVKTALETERELHLEAVQIANDQLGKADRELRRADLLESQVIKREQELASVKAKNAALHYALGELRDAAMSSHDFNCHGDCCATCCELVEAVDRANELLMPDAADAGKEQR